MLFRSNRLAWLLPYGAGIAGVTILAGTAIRWSRHKRTAMPADAPRVSDDLERRLDDELRELD